VDGNITAQNADIEGRSEGKNRGLRNTDPQKQRQRYTADIIAGKLVVEPGLLSMEHAKWEP